MPDIPQTPMATRSRSTILSSKSPYFSNPGPLSSSSPPSDSKSISDSEADSDSEKIQEDPLFRYYLRNFFVVYRRLARLKPDLIQESVAHDPWKLLIAVTLLNKTSGRLAIPAFWTIIDKCPTPWALSLGGEFLTMGKYTTMTVHLHPVDPDELKEILRPLGTQNIRSARLIKLSETYLRDPPRIPDLRPSTPRILASDSLSSYDPANRREKYPPTPISHLPGTGQYALDSYRIFCTVCHPSSSDEWKAVSPTDKELIRYLASTFTMICPPLTILTACKRWKWAFVERKEWAPGIGMIRPASLTYLNNLALELETVMS